MTEHPLASVLEAVLLAAGRPVSVEQLLELFDETQRPPLEEVNAALEALKASYEGRGVELREVASGWRVQVRAQHADVVSRLWQERPSRYSRALLETLALIAYRQPITRGEIEDIRGVTVSTTIMRTMHERNWIRVVGHREVPGRPELLGTTREFLDYFGLKSLDDLPTLAELQDLDDIKEQLDLPDAPIGVAEAAAVVDDATAAEAAGDEAADGVASPLIEDAARSDESPSDGADDAEETLADELADDTVDQVLAGDETVPEAVDDIDADASDERENAVTVADEASGADASADPDADDASASDDNEPTDTSDEDLERTSA
ncbi:MAG TPA: SMC-Scp complex subunit ScpB [Steroidobacteraceae bacterium]|nr:SMC-Scp complex subunit ScpB [Steroidobacteraceae bacterium]